MILMGAGVWVIVDLIRIATGSFLSDSAVDTSTSQPGVSAPARLQQRILLSAKHAGGAIMPTTVAMSSGIEINDAKRILETMVDEGHAELRARKDGTLVYVFPDLLTDEKRRRTRIHIERTAPSLPTCRRPGRRQRLAAHRRAGLSWAKVADKLSATGHRTRTGGHWTRQGAHQVHQARERDDQAAA